MTIPSTARPCGARAWSGNSARTCSARWPSTSDASTLTHLDCTVLPVLQRLARTRPVAAGPVLVALWEAMMAGRVRLSPPVRGLLRHLMERWHDLVRSQRDPDILTNTNRLEGWFGRFKPRARLAQGFGTEAGALNFVRLMAHAMA